MQHLSLKQRLQHKLSPQQLQLFKLLKNSTVEIDTTIKKALEENPMLEEIEKTAKNNIEEKIKGYRSWQYQQPKSFFDMPIIAQKISLQDKLLSQLGYLNLSEVEQIIGKEIIGNIDEEGYLRTDILTIQENIALSYYIETDKNCIQKILEKIQHFDPTGIGARNVQECLLLQLKKKQLPIEKIAYQIVLHCFDALSHKHYDRIKKRLNIQDKKTLLQAIHSIERLNPKPGIDRTITYSTTRLYPDFVLKKNQEKFEIFLSEKNYPKLGIKKYYTDLLTSYHNTKKKNKDIQHTITFLKTKYEHATDLIQGIKQRQHTLLTVMHAIVEKQRNFFLEEKEENLKPLRLQDIANIVKMDISTISRCISNKAIQTDLSTYMLKYFFTEKAKDAYGNEISNKKIKVALKNIITQENKQNPFSDEQIYVLLKKKGYLVARRTIAKYREKMNIPVSRLRKTLVVN